MLTEEQFIAVDSVEANVLVAAGAGSGKTHVLVERYVEILRRSAELSLANIIAVTFTRKAATEMRSRLKSKFLSLAKDEGEAGNEKRWLTCLSEVDSARIGTIHSLCESILKSYPADCGIDPQFEVLDELKQYELLEEASQAALREVIAAEGDEASQKASLEHALIVEFPIDDIKKTITAMLRASMQVEQAIKDLGDKEALRARAVALITQIKEQALGSLVGSATMAKLVAYARQNPHSDPKNALEAARLDYLDLFAQVGAEGDIEERFGALLALSQYKVGNVGGNKPEAKELRQTLSKLRAAANEIIEKVPVALIEEDERGFDCALAVIALYRRAAQIYKDLKAELTALDYNDLIAFAMRSLDNPQSRSRAFFNEKLRALLVDEFQDTNDIQATLLSMLAGPKTRLFLIGDDKQSIYKFQGADVATFNKWKERLAVSSPGGEANYLLGESLVTKLTASFRSHPDVVSFVNAVFARLLDRDPLAVPYVAAFEALSPARQSAGDEASRVEVILHDQSIEENVNSTSPTYEAHQVAKWIKQKVLSGYEIAEKNGAARPIRYGDFAVLVTRNKDFSQFEEVFAAQSIPYVTFGGSGFLRRQEVSDFENLFRFLGNPGDSHSLLAVLRSPFCAVSDDLIHRLATSAQGDSSETVLWTSLLALAEKRLAGFESLNSAARTLRLLLDYAALLPLSELTHKIVQHTKIELALLAAPDGKQRSRNVAKIAYLASENEHLSCGEFAERLSLMRQFGMREAEAPLDSGDSVKIMTVHASKGLEFPAVALPCLASPAVRGSERVIYHPSYGLAFNTKRLEEDNVPAWFSVAGYLDQQMELEERKRLLYVAMTRARDNLGVFMPASARNYVSYRQWLLSVLGIDDEASRPAPGASLELSLSLDGGFSSRYSLCFYAGIEAMSEADSSGGAGSEDVRLVPDGRSLKSNFDEIEPNLAELRVNTLGLSRITARRSLPSGQAALMPGQEELLKPSFVGIFFHALMENLPLHKRVESDWVADIAATQSLHMMHGDMCRLLVDEGMRLLEIYWESRLYELMRDARVRQAEMPYFIKGLERVETRRPDLILESMEGEFDLVDFKTDHIPAASIEMQARRHAHQLRTYARELEELSGEKLRTHIYFAQLGVLYPV